MKKYTNQLKRIRGEGGEGGGRDTKEVSRTTLIHGRTGRVGNWNIYRPIPSPRGNSNVFRRVTTLTSDLVRPSVLRLVITERSGWGGGGSFKIPIAFHTPLLTKSRSHNLLWRLFMKIFEYHQHEFGPRNVHCRIYYSGHITFDPELHTLMSHIQPPLT